MSKSRHPTVWKAVHEYVGACGGDPAAARERPEARTAAWALDRELDEDCERAIQELFWTAVEEMK